MNTDVTECEVKTADGRTLHVYDTGTGDGPARLTVVWHHGTPNLGAPPEPLLPASRRLAIRWVSYDRPGYGASTPLPGRRVGSAAADAACVADALGVGRFAVMGHSGGGPHALACAALLPDRVLGAVSVAGLAPYGAEGLDWFAGMCDSGRASLTAAAGGRRAKSRHEAQAAYDPAMFTEADHAALAGDWSWFEDVVTPALAGGPGGLIDDDLAYVDDWDCDPRTITCPVLLLHGGRDRVAPSAHAQWLADRCRRSTLRLRPDDGHISVLSGAVDALEWLLRHSMQ
ncbi:alpha/beta fold hydrolase [Streptomyces sp. NPDC048521]|uniref:alpha/beta fold hydrolase n=1 Tax=Streptomyces sp. NPDC048521 TaxID=3365566 RepID=UPI00371A3EEF